MSGSIKDLIFSQDSTLFEVLDQLDVPELLSLKSEVDTNSELLLQYKTQLDALAIKQDNFEGTTNANFVSINTNIENLSLTVDSLTESVSQNTVNIYNVGLQVGELNERTDDLTTLVNSFNERIVDLETETANLTAQIAGLPEQVAALSTQLDALKDKTLTGSKIMTGTTRIYFCDSRVGNRGIWTELTITDPWVVYGKRYSGNFVDPTGAWLSGNYDYQFRFSNTVVGPPTGTAPVVTGQIIYISFALSGGLFESGIPVYVYT